MREFRWVALAGAAAAALGVGALPASAALPPNYQRLAELRAILDNPELGRAFGTNQPIERIDYVRADLYRGSAGNCRMDMTIHTLPTPRRTVGARRFEVRAGQKVCAGR